MIDNKFVLYLHDRATRGEVLTESEQAALAAWYEQQDQAEATALGLPEQEAAVLLDVLRAEIAAATTRLREATQHIQARTEENETLCREINALSKKLIQTGSRQAV